MSRIRERNTATTNLSPSIAVEMTNDSSTSTTLNGTSLAVGQTKTVYLTVQSDYGKTGEISRITDNPGPYTGPIKPYREITHTKAIWDNPVRSFEFRWDEPRPTLANPKGAVRCKATGGLSGAAWSALTAPALLKSDSQLYGMAVGAMKPGSAPADVDIPLFVAELTDFSQFWKGLAKELTSNQHLLSAFYDYSTKERLRRTHVPFGSFIPQGTLVRADKTIAKLVGFDLAWKLAIQPLLDGINSIRVAWNALETSYKEKTASPYRVVRGQSSTTASNTTVTKPDWFGVAGKGVISRECHTWAMIKYDYAGYSPFKHKLNTFGLNPRLSTMYQLIPLSFVLDWFIGIGDFLEQLESSPIELPFQVVSSGVSYKTVYKRDLTISPLRGYYSSRFNIPDANMPALTGAYTSTNYTRKAQLINFDEGKISPPKLKLPNSGQVGTLTELLYLMFR